MFDKLFGSKLKYNAVKVSASSSFLDAINQEKSTGRIEENKKIQEGKYDDILESALDYMKKFTKSGGNDQESFREAASKLGDAQKLKPSTASPYFYLSWLFLYIRDFDRASKYFNIANVLDPYLEGLDELRDELEILILAKNKPATQIPHTKPVFNPSSPQNQTTKNQETSQGESFKPQALPNAVRKTNAYSQYKY